MEPLYELFGPAGTVMRLCTMARRVYRRATHQADTTPPPAPAVTPPPAVPAGFRRRDDAAVIMRDRARIQEEIDRLEAITPDTPARALQLQVHLQEAVDERTRVEQRRERAIQQAEDLAAYWQDVRDDPDQRDEWTEADEHIAAARADLTTLNE